MEKCSICLSKIKNKNEKRPEQSKKHKYFSNLIINKYIVKNPETDKLKDIIQEHYDEFKKKFDNFTVCVVWKKIDVLISKISVPSTLTLEKPHLFKPSMIELPIVIRVSPFDFLDTFDRNINNEVGEINIIFISNLDVITFSHYIAQPKSMPCRRLVRIFIEENYGNFDYNWLPKYFRNINT